MIQKNALYPTIFKKYLHTIIVKFVKMNLVKFYSILSRHRHLPAVHDAVQLSLLSLTLQSHSLTLSLKTLALQTLLLDPEGRQKTFVI